MSSAQAIRAELHLSGSAIREAIKHCEFIDRVIAHLRSQSTRMTEGMAKLTLELIAFRVMAKGLGKRSVGGAKALGEIMRLEGEIHELRTSLLAAAKENNHQMGPEIANMLPKLSKLHQDLEAALAALYEQPHAEDFGIAGQVAPSRTPVDKRKPARLTQHDELAEVGSEASRLVRKGLTLVEDLKEVAGNVKDFKLGRGGKSGHITIDNQTFKVRQVHVFDSAQGSVYMFDLVDPSSSRGTRRAVHTKLGGESKTFFEFTMLEEHYSSKPVFAQIIHAHHPVSDVLMNAFKAFGASDELGYVYQKWFTMLLSNGRQGTPHQIVTSLQASRKAVTDAWVTGAGAAFKAAIEFNKQFGKPNGMKLSEFNLDLKKFSFKPLIRDAEADLIAAGVPEAERAACLSKFRAQVHARIVPLLAKKLHPEHLKMIMEGL